HRAQARLGRVWRPVRRRTGTQTPWARAPLRKVEPKRSERAESIPPTPASILGSESSAAKPREGREEALVSRVRCASPKPATQLTDQQIHREWPKTSVRNLQSAIAMGRLPIGNQSLFSVAAWRVFGLFPVLNLPPRGGFGGLYPAGNCSRRAPFPFDALPGRCRWLL